MNPSREMDPVGPDDGLNEEDPAATEWKTRTETVAAKAKTHAAEPTGELSIC